MISRSWQMKRAFTLLIFLGTIGLAKAQQVDSIINRILFIGDAGKIDAQQKAVINAAVSKIIGGKTIVFYLGDNIYPKGMELPGSKKKEDTEEILKTQYLPFQQKQTSVYFIPGNHDWDRMGAEGLLKVKRQWAFLEEQQDTLIKMLPPNGCPGPVEILINENTVVLALDSEWWLFPYNKENPDADCECKTKDEIIAKLQELLHKHSSKNIILATHHPFYSYGNHGGYFSFTDHVFPFTALNKSLYIPLPVIGSLYPLLRSLLPNPEDLKHPNYENLRNRVGNVFTDYPNMVQLSGHEHGVQFIQRQNLHLVSGSGAKNSYAKKGGGSLFSSSSSGFIMADFLINKDIVFTVYTQDDDQIKPQFTFRKQYVPIPLIPKDIYQPIFKDSIDLRLFARYDSVSKFHRFWLGENYRKEYAALTRLPVLKMSIIEGGLIPTQRGGGFQTVSIRLKDNNGKEWALRSVEKYPEVIVPENLRETFAKDWVKDNMSSQHPFAALIVPPIAQAVEVPHSNPTIGVVSADKNLGQYNQLFANKVALLEEREPWGKSDNSEKMLATLNADNDNSVDKETYLRARILDLLIGDWDRHLDQWRWAYQKTGKNKHYIPVPRDRDQVFYLNNGVIPKIASQRWLFPFLQGFNDEVRNVNTFFWKARLLDGRFLTALSQQYWSQTTHQFETTVTDSLLNYALKQMPASAYSLRHQQLFSVLQKRRSNLVSEMNRYYSFLHKIVDIQGSDKNEYINVRDNVQDGLEVLIRKISKEGILEDTIYQKTFTPELTKEIRIYTLKGNDSLIVNNLNSNINIRLIGGQGDKKYDIQKSKENIRLYDKEQGSTFTGNDAKKLKKHLSNDSLNTAFEMVNLYNVPMFIIAGTYNVDDGVLLGLGYKFIRQESFRKKPYASMHQISVIHSFSTKAYRIRYSGEWIHTINNADFTVKAYINAPNNTMNFFGRGNETELDKSEGYKTYYRTRFNYYVLETGFRWRFNTASSLTIGPAVQYYNYNSQDNEDRFINNSSQIGSYDSTSIDQNKTHIGFAAGYLLDKRNNKILPQWGTYLSLKLVGYFGVGSEVKSYGQIIPELAVYKNINAKSSLVLANRIGGVVTAGKSTFYQSAFLGGHENLLGYLQYRFAGTHCFYNNLELRAKVSNVAGYILTGQLGVIGFYDLGRVWETGEHSKKWHNGFGGGIYFAPAQLAVLKFVMGKSTEGFYPYLTIGMRF
ncbi:BamA/TamA family outer membrane protein [Solitalea lacus]|uniref:BamA/TamA family outer membrane protein n=1 Tax=Solitalea lacus TaxID=2911172 RepID=UPI001EDAC5EB|nr:BamA/TamA family outer membrane protein [Solitalea lacus]UKJ06050.1 metallophosphoesterase [Solitalea lacus]